MKTIAQPRAVLLLSLTWLMVVTTAAHAEEGGSGHYLPGATGSFIDALPGREAFAYVNSFAYYNGSAGGSRQLELGGLVAANIDATAYADTSILLYETPWKLFSGRYAAAVAIPYVWMEVTADVQRTGRRGRVLALRQSDNANGVGDLQLLPFMLDWKRNDLSLAARVGVYAPTGEFERGRLANVGKNFWTFEPSVNASWFSSKIGLELSAFAGFDLNTRNEKTDYQSGDVFHLDATVAQHLPFWGGYVGVGASAFYYQQVTGDSGRGAVLGDFEGRTVGIGPVLSYTRKLGRHADLTAEIKWLPELDVTRRLKGDTIWMKLALVF